MLTFVKSVPCLVFIKTVHILFQIIDGESGHDNSKEKLCGDLTSWVPITATLPDSVLRTNKVDYVRNILVK